MKRRTAVKSLAAALPAFWMGNSIKANSFFANLNLHEPLIKGPFEPSWESLKQYEVPEWFRDAKFGMWAHWGPQCQPEFGDWYARQMYIDCLLYTSPSPRDG